MSRTHSQVPATSDFGRAASTLHPVTPYITPLETPTFSSIDGELTLYGQLSRIAPHDEADRPRQRGTPGGPTLPANQILPATVKGRHEQASFHKTKPASLRNGSSHSMRRCPVAAATAGREAPAPPEPPHPPGFLPAWRGHALSRTPGHTAPLSMQCVVFRGGIRISHSTARNQSEVASQPNVMDCTLCPCEVAGRPATPVTLRCQKHSPPPCMPARKKSTSARRLTCLQLTSSAGATPRAPTPTTARLPRHGSPREGRRHESCRPAAPPGKQGDRHAVPSLKGPRAASGRGPRGKALQ